MKSSFRRASASIFAERTIWIVLSVLAPNLGQAQESAKPPAGNGQTPPAAGAKPAPAAAAEAAPPAEGLTEEGGAAELSGANEAIYLKDYPRAARLAYVALTKTKPSAEKYESAQFALAQALEEMGLRQAAAEYYFAVAQQRQNPALLSRALEGLDRLARRGALDEEKLLRGVLVEAELSSIPPKVADFLHYHRGLANLRQGYLKWADKDFGLVRPDTYYGRRVELAKAAEAVRAGRVDDALKIVDTYLESEAKREEKEREEKGVLPETIAPAAGAPGAVEYAKSGPPSEARLIRARLLYEQEKFEQAVEEYQRVRQTKQSPAGELLLERAWAHFRAGEYHDAMGLLYALGAPSNRRLFLPDQYVLRGLIYQRFCHFRAAKYAVADYRARYGDAVAALKAGSAPMAVAAISSAAQNLIEVAPYVRVKNEVLAERESLENRAGDLEEGGLSAHLESLYTILDDRASWMLDRAMDDGSRLIAEGLLEADEQANLLEYEVGVSIFRPIKEEGGKVKAREAAEEVPSSGVRIYYPFDDEFWSDELPNMRFLIQDRCVE